MTGSRPTRHATATFTPSVHRRLLQGHLDLRASDEQVHASVRGADDIERTHHRRRARGLLTGFGLVTAMRMTYHASRYAGKPTLRVIAGGASS